MQDNQQIVKKAVQNKENAESSSSDSEDDEVPYVPGTGIREDHKIEDREGKKDKWFKGELNKQMTRLRRTGASKRSAYF